MNQMPYQIPTGQMLQAENAELRARLAEAEETLRSIRSGEPIDQIKRVQTAWRESEERERLALSAGKMATWDWSLPDGTVIWNNEHYRMLGYEPGTLTPSYQAWADRVHPSDLAETTARVQGSLAQGGRFVSEFRVVWPDGSIHWLEARGQTECDATNRPLRNYGVMLDFTARKQAEEEQKRIQEEIRKLNQELESRVVERTCELQAAVNALNAEIDKRLSLEREILTIGEREQSRIGRDLHDGVCQNLAALAMFAELAARNLDREKSPTAAKVLEISLLARQHLDEVRRLAAGLSPLNIEQNGLEWALRELATTTSAGGKTKCSFIMRQPTSVTNSKTAIQLYRIAQEALSNAMRHGQALNVIMELAANDGKVSLSICDDGSGLPRQPNKDGMGMHTMEYRARTLGGSLEVTSKAGRGTKVVCAFPTTT